MTRLQSLALAVCIFLSATASVLIAQQVNPTPKDSALACAYNATPPTPSPGNFAYVQCDSSGNLIASNLSPAPLTTGTQSYPIFAPATISPTTAAPSQNTARCAPFFWPWASHVDKATISVSTLGTGPINFALYSDAIDATTHKHQPQTLLTDPSLAFTVTGTGNASVSIGTAGTGIALPHGLVWSCINDTTAADAVRYAGLNANSSLISGLIGATAPAFAAGATQLNSLTITATAGLTTTNWPSFVGSTFTESNGTPPPNVVLEVATVP